MSENLIPEASDETGAAPTEKPVGLLRATREEKGLSLEEVAQALKLQPRQVVAMEEGDFLALGSTPHVRGFMRNYARHLGLDPQAVLALVESQVPLPQHELQGPADTGVSMPTPGGRKPLAWVLAASPLVLVALGAGILYALGVNFDRWRPASSDQPMEQGAAVRASQVALPVPTAAPAVSASASAGALPAASSVPPAPVGGVPAPVSAQPSPQAGAAAPVTLPAPPAFAPAAAPAMAQPAAAVPAPAPNALTNTHRIVLNFLKDSWVEIKQADGRALISQKVPGGNTRIVEGRPPFSVVIGNALSVQVQYDDRAVDLAPFTKVDVARLTLN
ncbi:MAG: DUF4115 domain-containing protein [Rhodocyclaceae bacterium]|nr:DUF4115 domain-containing protein [Rhodocyclaceae bacterium]